MDRDMFKSLTWWINMFGLLTLTKSQALSGYDADHSHVAQWKNKVPAVPKHQTVGQSISHPGPVAVSCYPDSMEVVVQADLFNTGLLVDGRHLRLGVEKRGDPSPCRAVTSGHNEFTVRAHFWECGTVKLPPTEERIIYSNVLIYSPEPSSHGLLRLDGAAIPVECHFDKFYSVKTLTLLPNWVNFVSQVTAESRINFSLKLMTGDWKFERKSHMYYVGEQMHFEVSFALGNHVPLRVYVDHCVATTTPDPEAALRYDFIDHHGCLADAYLTNSSARFLERTKDHRIRFQMDAFKFYQHNAKQIFITCHLTAVSLMANVKSKHRACSLIDNSWRSADGNDEDCTSCAIPYPLRDSPTRAPTTVRTRGKSEQPITSRGLSSIAWKQEPVTSVRVSQSPHQNAHSNHPYSVGLITEGENRKGMLKVGPLIILQEHQNPPGRRAK